MALFSNQVIIAFVSMLLAVTLSHAAETNMKLKKNPFKRPDFLNKNFSESTVVSTTGPGSELDIRAAMSAGENSLVNIAGYIIRIGEEIQGYQLISVAEGKVIFSKNNALVTVIIKRE